MAEVTRGKWLAAAGITTVVAGASSLFADDKPPNSPHVFRNISPRELIRLRHLPNIELISQDGKRVRFYDDLVKDKKFVINFMFTHCDKACPMITANLARVQKMLPDRIGHDIFIYSITLKPEDDSPRVLKQYAKAFNAGPGWLFLTGRPKDIQLLRAALGFTYPDPVQDADLNNHIGMLRIGNEPLMRWAACEGQAHASWIATTILTEMDSPFKGAVDGVRLADPTLHIK